MLGIQLNGLGVIGNRLVILPQVSVDGAPAHDAAKSLGSSSMALEESAIALHVAPDAQTRGPGCETVWVAWDPARWPWCNRQPPTPAHRTERSRTPAPTRHAGDQVPARRPGRNRRAPCRVAQGLIGHAPAAPRRRELGIELDDLAAIGKCRPRLPELRVTIRPGPQGVREIGFSSIAFVNSAMASAKDPLSRNARPMLYAM